MEWVPAMQQAQVGPPWIWCGEMDRTGLGFLGRLRGIEWPQPANPVWLFVCLFVSLSLPLVRFGQLLGIYIYNSVLTRRHIHINSSASTPPNATKITEMKDSHHGQVIVGPELLFSIYKCCFLEFVCAK